MGETPRNFTLEYVDIVTINRDLHVTSLGIESDGGLMVIGSLIHLDRIRPKTARDRDKLVEYLQRLEYK